MAWKKKYQFQFLGKEKLSNALCILATTLRRLIYHERCTVISVPTQSVMVHLARRGFEESVVYCLLPPTLVYFAVMQTGLFSVYFLIHCITTFSELPQALC